MSLKNGALPPRRDQSPQPGTSSQKREINPLGGEGSGRINQTQGQKRQRRSSTPETRDRAKEEKNRRKIMRERFETLKHEFPLEYQRGDRATTLRYATELIQNLKRRVRSQARTITRMHERPQNAGIVNLPPDQLAVRRPQFHCTYCPLTFDSVALVLVHIQEQHGI